MVKNVTIAGYKPFELGIFKRDHQSVEIIKKAIFKELVPLLEEGLEWVIISGQLGVELWAAEVVFEIQNFVPELKLAVLTPFYSQEEKWNETNKEWYESILAQADFVESITHKPYESPEQFRLKNQVLLHKSDLAIVLYDSEKEGSPKYFYETAKKYREATGYQIREITFYDLQIIAEEELSKSLEQ
ncbi:SLOG family protein [Pseudoneobacillus sp. C159]